MRCFNSSCVSSGSTACTGCDKAPTRLSISRSPRRNTSTNTASSAVSDGVARAAAGVSADARPGEPLFSTLAVVRNPADQYPLYACIVIAAGLVLHFSRRLTRYVSAEGKAA